MTRTSIAAALILAVAACGGADADAPASALAQAPDTSIKPLEREALTEVDMVGLDMANLAVELPWTRNKVNRNPTPNAARALVESVEVSSHDGFDRTVFSFGPGVAFPGYSAEIVDAGTPVMCGDPNAVTEGVDAAEEADTREAPQLEGPRLLVLRVRPARTSADGRTTLQIGTTTYGHMRVQEAGAVCAADDVVTWLSGMSEGTDIRVLEMRSPARLVVDVR